MLGWPHDFPETQAMNTIPDIITFLEDQIVQALTAGNIAKAQMLRMDLTQIREAERARDAVTAPTAKVDIDYSLN